MKMHVLWILSAVAVGYLVSYVAIAAILSFFGLNLNFYWTFIPGLLLIWWTVLSNLKYRNLIEQQLAQLIKSISPRD